MNRPAWGLIALTGCAVVPSERAQRPGRAWLGVETRAPAPEVARELELPFNVRVQGLEVVEVAAAGPAAAAGLASGDVLLSLDHNDLYSRDDLADFVATCRPGQRVEVRFRRPGDARTRTAALALGNDDGARDAAPFSWRFAGCGQMVAALEEARVTGRELLVGLSGAET
jgi:hypothetical protein